jgi:hypothetical protein
MRRCGWQARQRETKDKESANGPNYLRANSSPCDEEDIGIPRMTP